MNCGTRPPSRAKQFTHLILAEGTTNRRLLLTRHGRLCLIARSLGDRYRALLVPGIPTMPSLSLLDFQGSNTHYKSCPRTDVMPTTYSGHRSAPTTWRGGGSYLANGRCSLRILDDRLDRQDPSTKHSLATLHSILPMRESKSHPMTCKVAIDYPTI